MVPPADANLKIRMLLILIALIGCSCLLQSAQYSTFREGISQISNEQLSEPKQISGNEHSPDSEDSSAEESAENNAEEKHDFSDIFLPRRGFFEGREIPAPQGLSVIGEGKGVDLAWDEYPLPVAGFRVYRDGVLVNRDSLITENRFQDKPPAFFSEHYYYITAILPEKIESFPSDSVHGTALTFSGRGTEADPYIIKTAEQLSQISHSRDSYYRLEADIDLGIPPWNENEGWNPISSFRGSFDGNGHKITNLTINRPDSNGQGLFSIIRSAVIKNLGLLDVNITAKDNVGAVASEIVRSAIKNCYVTGRISAGNRAGGITGAASPQGIIRNCYNAASLEASGEHVGGLTGRLRYSNIVNSYSIGEIIFVEDIEVRGALVNNIVEGRVINSFWDIFAARFTTDEKGAGKGLKTELMLDKETFTDWDFDEVWAIGDEKGEQTYPWLRIQKKPGKFNYPGYSPVNDLYAYTKENGHIALKWSAPYTGEPHSYNIYRDEQLIKTVPSSLFSYTDNTVEPLETYKYHVTAVYDEENSEPSFPVIVTALVNGYAGGKGTAAEPYLIALPSHLHNVRYNPQAYYTQTENLDLSEYDNWQPIGDSMQMLGVNGVSYQTYFSGKYNGGGFEISNLTLNMERDEPAGLFGSVGIAGRTTTLKNIRLNNVSVTGVANVGGLAGKISRNSKIENCGVSGKIAGITENGRNFGGLLGYVRHADLFRCYSKAKVSADAENVGGLIGKIKQGDISESYTLSDVKGKSNVGNFIGFIEGESIFSVIITNCFARGTVDGTDENIGGFFGYMERAQTKNCYAVVDRLVTPTDEESSLTFIGSRHRTLTFGTYWKGIDNDEDDPVNWELYFRTEQDMKYPFGEDTFNYWDFDDVWQVDPDGKVNDGFPFFRYWNEDVREVRIITRPHRRRGPFPEGLNNERFYTEEGVVYHVTDEDAGRRSFLAGYRVIIYFLLGFIVTSVIYFWAFRFSYYIGLVLLIVNASALVHKGVKVDLPAIIILKISLLIGLFIFLFRYKKNTQNKA